MKIRSARRFKIAALIIIPVLLYLGIAERQSWQPRTLPALHGSSEVGALLWVDNGKSLMARSENRVCLWDTSKKSLRRSLKIEGSAYRIMLSAKGLLAYEVPGRDTCYMSYDLWDLEKNKRVLSPNLLMPIIFSPDGRQIIGGKHGYETIILSSLDVRSARVQKTVSVTMPKGLHLRAKGISGGGTCSSATEANHVLSRTGKWGAASLFMEGKKAVYVGAWWKPSVQGDVLLFNAQTGKHISLLPASRLPQPISELPQGGSMMSFSADEKTLIIAGTSEVQLWDIRTSQLKRHIKDKSFSVYPYPLVDLSPDGNLLACTGRSSDRLSLWNVATGQLERQPKTKGITCLAFAPDSSTLATGHENGTIRLWRLR
jgi:WD40 repeat protein